MKATNNAATAGKIVKNGKLIATEITINATPSRVWKVLVNFEAYPSWNPFIKSISGPLKAGAKLEANICPPGAKGMVFKPTVINCEANKELRWLGSLGMPYIFDGEHTFKLEDNGDGTTRFLQFERFRGILTPFLSKMLDVNTLAGFELMNQQLKQIAEKH
jgi:hypothetical protein